MEQSIRFPGIMLTVDPVLRSVKILGYDISMFGILIAGGLVIAMVMTLISAARKLQSPNRYLAAILLSVPFGTAFARAVYVLCCPDVYGSDPFKILNLRAGGLSLYGAVFGCIIAVFLVSIPGRIRFSEMADTMAPGAVLLIMVGRWGDFFNRSSFGDYTNWVTAMQVPVSAVDSGEVTRAMQSHIARIGGVSYYQMHPVFLYESLWCLIVLIALMVLGHRKHFAGENFLRFLTWYGFGRFFLEFLRVDKLMIPGTTFPLNLLLSLLSFGLCGVSLLGRGSMARKREAYQEKRRQERRMLADGEETEEEPDADDLLPAEPEKAGASLPGQKKESLKKLEGALPEKSIWDEL